MRKKKRTGISSLLHCMTVRTRFPRKEKGIIWESEQEGGLFHHLEDRVFDWRCIGGGERVQVEGDDSYSVRELFYNVLLANVWKQKVKMGTYRHICEPSRGNNSDRDWRER
jgi:hypothetical protein